MHAWSWLVCRVLLCASTYSPFTNYPVRVILCQIMARWALQLHTDRLVELVPTLETADALQDSDPEVQARREEARARRVIRRSKAPPPPAKFPSSSGSRWSTPMACYSATTQGVAPSTPSAKGTTTKRRSNTSFVINSTLGAGTKRRRRIRP